MTPTNKIFMIAAIALTCLPAIARGQQIEAYFSPDGGCTAAIVKQLNAATSTIELAAYSLSSKPITNALITAHKRGIRVRVIVDKLQESYSYSTADIIAASGIPTKSDARHAIFHNKYIIVDGKTTITGSFNFTDAAENRNAENLLLIVDEKLATAYRANFEKHSAHSTPFQSKHQKPPAALPPLPSPTTKDYDYGTSIRTVILAGCEREIWGKHGCFQVERPKLLPETGHAEKSEICQTDGCACDGQLLVEGMGGACCGHERRLRRPSGSRRRFAVQCLHGAKSLALAAVKGAFASVSRPRGNERLRNHLGTVDRPRGLRDGCCDPGRKREHLGRSCFPRHSGNHRPLVGQLCRRNLLR